MKRIAIALVLICCLFLFTGCVFDSLFGNSSGSSGKDPFKNTVEVTVQFNTGESRKYDVTKDGTSVDFIAKAGTRLTGVVTESGVKIATSDGIMRISSQLSKEESISAHATYADAVTSYTVPTEWEEAPHSLDWYSGKTLTWKHNEATANEAELAFISSLKCNPYAKLTITMFVDVKMGSTTWMDDNKFIFKIKVGDEVIASASIETGMSDSYGTKKISGTIKALQFQNAYFRVGRVVTAKDATCKYLVKNIGTVFTVDYSA